MRSDVSAPSGRLPIPISRRRLLPALLREATTLGSLLGGGRAFQLADLGLLSDERLGRIVPVLLPGYELYLDGGAIWSRAEPGGTRRRQLAGTPENVRACALLDGTATLAEIGRQLAAEHGWPERQGFARAREVFLILARRLICVPTNAPE